MSERRVKFFIFAACVQIVVVLPKLLASHIPSFLLNLILWLQLEVMDVHFYAVTGKLVESKYHESEDQDRQDQSIGEFVFIPDVNFGVNERHQVE
tara:strand:- start:25 stop:309 length:285 start_codon:yes stop_codon:yes gene_type:complete